MAVGPRPTALFFMSGVSRGLCAVRLSTKLSSTMTNYINLVHIFLTYNAFEISSSSRIAMKFVEAPVSYGLSNDLIGPNFNPIALTPLVIPANFSGPKHLKSLDGRCFNYSDENYLFTFCPFQNVTQQELTNRWNAYHGILGIWQEWKITNNTFSSMIMSKGELCGDIHRSVEVIFQCNESEEIHQVAEPSRCTYLLIFNTPLVCHPDSLLVYPYLSPELQQKWDELETELNLEFISNKGYEKGLNEILLLAGFYQQHYDKDKSVLTETRNVTDSHFTNLQSCMKEVEELKNEIEGLKILVELKSLPDTLKNPEPR